MELATHEPTLRSIVDQRLKPLTRTMARGSVSSTYRILALALTLAVMWHGLLIALGLYRASYDAYVHIFFADHYRRAWFDLWEPRWYLGFSVTTYPPLVHQLIALLSFGIGLEPAFDVVLFAVLVTFPLGVYAFARIFVGARTSAWAALLTVFLPSLNLAAYTFGQLPTLFSTLALLFALNRAFHFFTHGRVSRLVEMVAWATVTAASHHATLILFGSWAYLAVLLRAWSARRYANTGPIARRALLAALLMASSALGVIFPFWLWAMHFALQVPIDHPSRDNFLTSETARGLFLWPMYGPLLLLTGWVMAKGLRSRRLRPLFFLVVWLFLLGLGGTTPLPTLVFGPNWVWLTYDRFAFWASITLLPFAGLWVAKCRLDQRVCAAPALADLGTAWRRSYTDFFNPLVRWGQAKCYWVFIGMLVATALFAANIPTLYQTQPPPLDMQPVVDFLARDGHDRWRYLTFGFGDQAVRLQYLTRAETPDGSYHTARTLPELTQSGVGQLDSVFWTAKSMDVLLPFVTAAERFNLRWIFIADSRYTEIVARSGWRSVGHLNARIAVWERAGAVPPMPARTNTHSTFDIHALAWGILPLSALGVALLATFIFRWVEARRAKSVCSI